jgi:cytochrome b561
MNTQTHTDRYDRVAVFLHWTIALLIIIMIAVGLTMGDYPIKYKFIAYNLHKSTGLTILALSLFRLYWRLSHKPPHLPEGMSGFEKFAAKSTHWMFYFLIIAMPLSGWIMVSADAKFPTVFFWLFQMPQFPLPAAYDTHATHEKFEWLHYWLAMGTLGLLALHVGAALKHHLINRDSVLRRMLPLRLQRKDTLVL